MLVMIRTIFICLIVAAFFAISVLTIKSPTQETTEQRALAIQPTVPDKYQDIQQYLKGLDAWASDRMHYRQMFITCLNRIRYQLGFSVFPSVVVGKDHWLFFAGAKEDEDARGTVQFTPEELQRWKSYLLYRDADVKARGGKFVFVVGPNKSTIYPEYLPENFKIMSKNSRLQQLTDVMKDTNVSFIDLRPVFFEAKKQAPIYLKTDTHWNMQAANYAQYSIMQELSKSFPDIKPKLFPFHHITATDTGPIYQGGDLWRMLGFYDALDEPNVIIVDNVGACAGIANEGSMREWPLTVGDCAKATTQQNDRAWFDVIHNHWGHLGESFRDFLFKASFNKQGKYNVFVEHDSYIEMLQPFLSNQFKYVHYSFLGRPLDMNVWSWFLDALHPDIVIEEIVERNLKETIPRPGLDYPIEFDTQAAFHGPRH